MRSLSARCFDSKRQVTFSYPFFCPLLKLACSVKTQNFVRLYLDVGSLTGVQCQIADKDDISLSSIEENDDDEDRNQDDSKESKEQDSTKDDDDENDGVVDLTSSPPKPVPECTQSRKSSAINNSSDDSQEQSQLQRLTRIAKKFKKQYLQKSAQYKEQYAEKRKLSDRIRQAESDLSNIREDFGEAERDRELLELKMNESQLQLMRIQQERESLHSRCSTMAQEKSRAETKLRECYVRYERELEMARAKSMSEVQEIMEEHPKVVEENRALRQKLQKLNRSLSRGSSTSSIDTSSRSHSKTKDIHKALRQMDQLTRSRESTRPPSKPIESGNSRNSQAKKRQPSKFDLSQFASKNRASNSLKVNSGQYSSLASRMMKASQKAKRPPPGSGTKRPAMASLSLTQNKRMKSFSASRRDLFQRKP